MRKIYYLILTAFLASLVALSHDVSAENAALHASSTCRPMNNLFAVSFSTKNNESTRSIVFDFDYDDVRIGATNVKGTVKWSEIFVIVYEAQTESSGFMTIEFTAPILLGILTPHKKIQFGMITRDCWDFMLSEVAERTGVAFKMR